LADTIDTAIYRRNRDNVHEFGTDDPACAFQPERNKIYTNRIEILSPLTIPSNITCFRLMDHDHDVGCAMQTAGLWVGCRHQCFDVLSIELQLELQRENNCIITRCRD
jgi:hypothetical protein